jgi:hypothetical protein
LVRLAGDTTKERGTRGSGVEATRVRGVNVEITGGSVKAWLADLGLWGPASRGKHIPACVFTWNRTAVARFLRTLFSCDGHITVSRSIRPDKPHTEVGYSSASRRLVDDVAHLLRRFGVRCRIRYVKGMLNGVEHGAFSLNLGGFQSMITFLDEIGIDRPHAKEVREDIGSRLAHTKQRDLHALAGGLRWEAVKRCSPAGEAHVYDLTVPGLHNFLANDIVVHNTRWAGSWPRPLFLSDATEGGWTTIESMDESAYWEPDVPPIVWAIETAQDMSKMIMDARPLIAAGRVQTIVLDSITFYGDLYLNHLLSLTAAKGDQRQVYGLFANHLRDLRERLHGLGVNVVWLALAKAPDADTPTGGPMITGQSGQKLPAACDYVFYHRSAQVPGQPGKIAWEVRTKRYGGYQAGGRDEGRLPDPLPDTTYRSLISCLAKPGELHDAVTPLESLPAAPQQVPATAAVAVAGQRVVHRAGDKPSVVRRG